jgi:hypothetical protein
VRPLSELLSGDPAWPHVRTWIADAENEVVVVASTRERGEHVLHLLQVTSRSILGAVALETGGILVDRGWLRILGCGSARMQASLASWNGLGSAAVEPLERAFLVAHDAVGGFFAVDGGALGGERGEVRYLAPDTLVWERLADGYSDFVAWTLAGDLDGFYDGLRWPGWENELAKLSPDEGFLLLPPPFAEQGKPVANTRRTPVPMTELWAVQLGYAHQLEALPEGADIQIRVE